jgi:spermidine synthase
MLNYHSDDPLRVGVVGLGTGTIAAYGGRSDFFCFYEINPNVREIALNRFTYLTESDADCKIVLGDARLSLERQSPQQYDIIALDAFSSDAIPVHLLTTEAFELYLRHLRPQGVIAVHISNRHLDLKPVVGEIARHLQIPAVLVENSDDDEFADAASADWLLLTHNESFLKEEAIESVAEDVVGTYTPIPRWTDQYSNLFQILD